MKKIKQLLLALVLAIACVNGVNAASGTITVSSGTKTAVVGSTFKVTVRVKCSEAIGSWKYSIAYDSAYISLVSGNITESYVGDGKMTYKDYEYQFRAIKSGNAGIRIVSPEMAAWNGDISKFTPAVNSITVSVKTQAEIQASYSKDNYLKSLTVKDYELSPAFDKDTLEYKVSVPDTVEQIQVSALVNDARSRVTGAGTIDISEGTNKVEIVVTAQNGGTRTYTLTVDVRDLNPIEVDVDGEKYTIVKKDTLLKDVVGFSKSTMTIDGTEVPVCKNDHADLVLVGLKDTSGEIGMFLYDEKEKSYKKYTELVSSSLTLLPVEIESIPDGFSKAKLKINGEEFEAMKNNLSDNFYLVYALDVSTGEKSYYQYDLKSNGLIRYDSEAYSSLLKENNEFKLFLIAACSLAGIFFLLTVAMGVRVSKLKKVVKKVVNKEMKINSEEESSKKED